MKCKLISTPGPLILLRGPLILLRTAFGFGPHRNLCLDGIAIINVSVAVRNAEMHVVPANLVASDCGAYVQDCPQCSAMFSNLSRSPSLPLK